MSKQEISGGTLLLILIAGYFLLSVIGGSMNPLEWSFMQKQAYTPTGQVSGIFDIAVVPYQTLDIGASPLTHGTNYNCFFYANRGGWMLLGGGTSQTVEVIPSDGGYIYAVVEVVSGQNYYVDAATTKAKNPRVVAATYEDPDNDGYKEFVFKFSMADIPKPASGNPKVYFYPYFYAYEKPTINSPADIINIGGSKVTKYIEWYLSFATQKRAFAISKVELSINTTDQTKVTLINVNIPTVGYISGNAFGSPMRGVNSLTWTYTIGANLHSANYLTYGVNQLNKFDCTTQIECQLQSGDVLELTITIYGLTPTDTITTITDSVVLKYGS